MNASHYFSPISLNSFSTMASYQGMLTLALTVVLLALPSLTCRVTLHVRSTSTNTSCPTHPCHTLSEYTQHPGKYFNDSNLTLQLLPGNHALSVNLTITGIHQLELHGNSNAEAPTSIVCSSNVGFTFRDIYRMKVDGLTFAYCARSGVAPYSRRRNYLVTTYQGLYLQSVQLADISDCTLRDSYGSALGVVGSHVVLRGNSFLNNCRLCSNRRCYSSGPNCFGGGVFASRSNVSFIGSYFGDENTTVIGNSGGGIHVETNSNIDINGNSVFLGNSADSGGGIHAETNSNVDISGNTIFIGNSGGGVYAHFNSNININGNTTFIGNSARNGGGIYARFGSNINISGNTTFINNSVSGKYPDGKGGGIHASDYSNIIINGNTKFINNTAKKNGGGIYTECASNINIGGNTTFISNSASGGVYKIGHFGIADLFSPRGFTMKSGRGGGIYTSGHCESGEHSQIKLGMGLYVVIDHMLHKIQLNNEVKISGNTTFICNSAGYGGGVYILYNNNTDITGNTIFIGNSATVGEGGGVYAGDETNVNICGVTTFTSNSAGGNGGGVYAHITSNVNVSESTNFIGNSATDGGGLYVESHSNVKITGSTIFASNLAV